MCQRNHFRKKLKQLEMSQQALPKQRKRENANCKKKSKKSNSYKFLSCLNTS